jgi:hypothetical protein
MGAEGAPPQTVVRGLELHVPRAKGDVVLDGDMDDTGWLQGCARTGPFVGPDGESARPYSDARFVWGDGYLYVALYAADEDIRARHEAPDAPVWLDDSFHLVLGDGAIDRSFDFGPTGALADAMRSSPTGAFDFAWSSGAHVSHELDGTPNDPTDDDEEWVIEAAIPLASLGLQGEPGERTGLAVRRCDRLHSGARSCGHWGEGEAAGVLVLD